MIVGIEATNISSGGGLTHLVELLRNAEPKRDGFTEIYIWCSSCTARKLPKNEWLNIQTHPLLDGSLIVRYMWKVFFLTRNIRYFGCNVLYSPGANYNGPFHPYVSCSQNLLPFDIRERDRFKYSFTWLRYLLLGWAQSRSFKNADGMVFLSNTAKTTVSQFLGHNFEKTAIIAHGISEKFRQKPQCFEVSPKTNFRWLYVSIINFYKHQCNVVKAVDSLKSQGVDVELTLIGPAYPKALKKLKAKIKCLDNPECINYLGEIPYDEIADYYKDADGFVFASSCENLPNILIEAMSAGLPIACSNKEPMPEVLEKTGIYFNSEDIESIQRALNEIMRSRDNAYKLALESYKLSGNYSWKLCSQKTFKYIIDVARNYNVS